MSLFRNENPILGANAKVRSTELGADVKLIPVEYISTEMFATDVDKWIWVAPYPCQVTAVKEFHSVAGTDAGAVTVGVRKVTANAVAPGAAAGANVKEFLTADLNLKATANTVVSGTLSSTVTDLQLAKGDRIGVNYTGVLTALVGYLQIEVKKI